MGGVHPFIRAAAAHQAHVFRVPEALLDDDAAFGAQQPELVGRLAVQRSDKLRDLAPVAFLNGVSDLQQIERQGGMLHIGAAVTIAAPAEPEAPAPIVIIIVVIVVVILCRGGIEKKAMRGPERRKGNLDQEGEARGKKEA